MLIKQGKSLALQALDSIFIYIFKEYVFIVESVDKLIKQDVFDNPFCGGALPLYWGKKLYRIGGE